MDLFWTCSSPAGRLGTATRPRGGDWLAGELEQLVVDGVHELVSMLTPPENVELALDDEAVAARSAGLVFRAVPIPDRGLPERTMPFVEAVHAAVKQLRAGSSVVVHCRMGVGRSSMFAAACLISLGVAPSTAWADIARVRGRPVPDVEPQRAWIDGLVPLLQRPQTPPSKG